jgi:UDP-GlcNAc:undecaprenyl-phosphate GlcNAc-1-phosphate transferase
MSVFFLTILIILFNLIFYLKFNVISKFTFLDKPDGKLKRHSNPTSLIGGLVILINLYLIFFFLMLLDIDNSIFKNNFLNAIIILSTLFYLVGLIDDLKNLSPNIKLLSLILSIFFVAYLFPEINLELIKISFLKKTYYFNEYSFFFTILSFLLLANAINMFDGINLQIFIFIVFIIKGFLPLFFILLSISFIFLGLLNFKNKVFIGDGGCYLISALLGCSFIYQYKNYDNFLFGDEIFIILLIPAIDMLRLFFSRIISKKHPFKGDLNHLHHIVDNYVKNKNLTVLITICLCVFPSFLMILEFKTYYILIINLIVYLSIILFLKNKKNI